jgi:ubiquinone/menaquinone biosynthesis C-methylase UbiE
MKTPTDFRHESYQRHVAHYDNLVNGTDSNLLGRIWTDESTVDAWRHRRMHELLTPFLEAHAGARWLTVGDGRYGNEAHYLMTKNVEVMASDISDTLLKEANASGYIKDFRKENAEALSFGDDAFDYILCKESFHHFPRPMIAMYEMLRVARTAVVLIEPCDPFVEATVPQILFRRLLNIVKRLAGLPRERHRFEEVGNYVYSVSRRELEKVAMGLNYRAIASRGLNDWYEKGVESEKAEAGNALFRKVRLIISVQDLLMKLKLNSSCYLVAAIFKEAIPEGLRESLSGAGYDLIDLPANPHHGK